MNYFKPLRRKLGVATLPMACVFMAGWVSSLEAPYVRKAYRVGIELTGPGFKVVGELGRYQPGRGWQHEGLFRIPVPYWSIVIPLTLLSGYLLLSKPRVPVKPAPNAEGTQ